MVHHRSEGRQEDEGDMTPENYECRKCHHRMFVPDEMEPLDEDVRFCESCAIDEIERLQATLDRFPTTADGEPIVPGLQVFSVSSTGEIWDWIVADMNTVDLIVPASQARYRGKNVDELYSTRKAAEKARQNADK